MDYHTPVPDWVRRRYSAKVTTVAGALAIATVGVAGVLASHALASVESGSDPAGAVAAAFVGTALVVAVHFGLAAVVLGPGAASTAAAIAERADRAREGGDGAAVQTDRIDEFGRAATAVDGACSSLRATIDDLQTERERAKEARVATEGQTEALVAEAERFGEVMAACADGDLTQRLTAQTDDEALRAIAASFNRMLSELERTVLQVQRFTDVVDDASGELLESAREIGDASEAVSASVREISEGSTAQTDDLEKAAAEVKELSATVEEVAATTSTIAEASTRVAELADDGMTAASSAAAEMHDAETRTEHVAETITQLNEDVAEIDDAIALIDDIAHQTNMLALNAAIETARTGETEAGDAGGFDVVADEVQDLSAEIQEAVDEIQATIDAIQAGASTSAEEIAAVEDHVGAAAATVDSLEGELETMAERIDRVDDGVQEIDRATNDQARTVEQLAGLVEDVAVVSAATSEQADRVAASSTEAADEIGDVAAKARSLDSQADRLTDVVGQFDVSTRQQLSEGAPAAPPADERDATAASEATDATEVNRDAERDADGERRADAGPDDDTERGDWQ